jgi:hypothetical protein
VSLALQASVFFDLGATLRSSRLHKRGYPLYHT